MISARSWFLVCGTSRSAPRRLAQALKEAAAREQEQAAGRGGWRPLVVRVQGDGGGSRVARCPRGRFTDTPRCPRRPRPQRCRARRRRVCPRRARATVAATAWRRGASSSRRRLETSAIAASPHVTRGGTQVRPLAFGGVVRVAPPQAEPAAAPPPRRSVRRQAVNAMLAPVRVPRAAASGAGVGPLRKGECECAAMTAAAGGALVKRRPSRAQPVDGARPWRFRPRARRRASMRSAASRRRASPGLPRASGRRRRPASA